MHINTASLTSTLRNTLRETLLPVRSFIQNKVSWTALAVFSVISTLVFISFCYFRDKSKQVEDLTDHQKKITQKLEGEIEFYKKQNKLFEKQIQRCDDFMVAHPDLMLAYQNAYEQKKNILLPPPEKHIPEKPIRIDNSLVEEWRKVQHQNNHLDKIRRRIFDFLYKNPEFCQLIKDELGEDFIPQGYIE